jgi:hypothetical protein
MYAYDNTLFGSDTLPLTGIVLIDVSVSTGGFAAIISPALINFKGERAYNA